VLLKMATLGSGARIQTTFWRIAGLSFPKYANLTARTMRKCVKPDAARVAKLGERDYERLNFRNWVNGKRGPLGALPHSRPVLDLRCPSLVCLLPSPRRLFHTLDATNVHTR